MPNQPTNLIVEQFQQNKVPPLPPNIPDTPEARALWEQAQPWINPSASAPPPPVEKKEETPKAIEGYAEPAPSIAMPFSMYGKTQKDIENAFNVAPDTEAVNRIIERERQQSQQFEEKLRHDDPYLYDVLKSKGVSVDGVDYEPGVEAYNAAVEKRNKDLTDIYKRSEAQFKDKLRKDDPYLYGVYATCL